jgi:hypothetical protein
MKEIKELIERYVNEIKFLEEKLHGIKYSKNEIILNALQTEYINLLNEITSIFKLNKEELINFVRDKELLKRHIIL